MQAGTYITALNWETSDNEGPTRSEFQANWNSIDGHIHDNRTKGSGIRSVQTTAAPVQPGDVVVSGDAFEWWGGTSSAVKTAVDTNSSQTLTNKVLTAPSLGQADVTDYEDFTDGATPAAPAAGKTRIYTKSGKPYFIPNGGSETAFGPSLDTTAADIAAVGTVAAAGSVGKAADSGHVHTVGTGAVDTAGLAANAVTVEQLSYDAAVDIWSGTVLTNGSWQNVITDQSFTVADASSIVEVHVRVTCTFSTTANLGLAFEAFVDSTTEYRLGRHVNETTGMAGSPISGTFVITGLSAGTHNVRIRYYSDTSGTCTAYLRASSIPYAELLSIKVLERKR